MFFDNDTLIPNDRFIATRVEAEIAFVMKDDLVGEATTREQVIAATEFVCPSLEILDTRIVPRDPNTGAIRTVIDTISDNAANAGLVLGDERHPIDAFDLRWVGAIVSNNGDVENWLGRWRPERPCAWDCLVGTASGTLWPENSCGRCGVERIVYPDLTSAGRAATIDADFGAFGRVGCSF